MKPLLLLVTVLLATRCCCRSNQDDWKHYPNDYPCYQFTPFCCVVHGLEESVERKDIPGNKATDPSFFFEWGGHVLDTSVKGESATYPGPVHAMPLVNGSTTQAGRNLPDGEPTGCVVVSTVGRWLDPNCTLKADAKCQFDFDQCVGENVTCTLNCSRVDAESESRCTCVKGYIAVYDRPKCMDILSQLSKAFRYPTVSHVSTGLGLLVPAFIAAGVLSTYYFLSKRATSERERGNSLELDRNMN